MRRGRRRLRVGEVVAVAANPARVEEEEGEEKDDGGEDHDEEERAALDLEAVVI
jgi:hypothetical protein